MDLCHGCRPDDGNPHSVALSNSARHRFLSGVFSHAQARFFEEQGQSNAEVDELGELGVIHGSGFKETQSARGLG